MRWWTYTASTVVAACLIAGCGSEDAQTQSADGDGADWGPLTVLPPTNSGHDAGADGTLRITDNCVYLEPMLVAWPANHATWDPTAASITYDNGHDPAVVIADGDALLIGGSLVVGDGGEGVEPAEETAAIDWVVPPHEACEATEVWGVSGVRLADDEESDSSGVGADRLDPAEYLPGNTLMSDYRPAPQHTLSGRLIETETPRCLALVTADGERIDLVWSNDHMNFDGEGVEVPGYPARFVLLGEEMEVGGDWFAGHADQYDRWATEPCAGARHFWVYEIADGGLLE